MGIYREKIWIYYDGRSTSAIAEFDTNSELNIFPMRVAEELKIPRQKLEFQYEIGIGGKYRPASIPIDVGIQLKNRPIAPTKAQFVPYTKSIIGVGIMQDVDAVIDYSKETKRKISEGRAEIIRLRKHLVRRR